MLNAGHRHTPAELADLRIIRDRTLDLLADDTAPMVAVKYDQAGHRTEQVIPWRIALEIEGNGPC